MSVADLTAQELPDWMQAGVRLNSIHFSKAGVLRLGDIGVVTDIKRGELRHPGNIELGIAGNYGARFFDQTGNLNSTVDFGARLPDGFRVSAKFVMRTVSHGLLLFRQAAPAATYDSLCDSDGKEIWRTPYHSIASAFADLDAIGHTQFVLARQNRGIESRDESGKSIWEKPQNAWVWQISAFSSPGRKLPSYLVGADETLDILAADGTLVSQQKPVIRKIYPFSMIHWSAVPESNFLVVSDENQVHLLSIDGVNELAVLPAPQYIDQDKSLAINLLSNEPPYLAIVGYLNYKGRLSAGFEAIHSELYIYDSNKRLVYDEVLPERVGALGVVPSTDGKREVLLMGGENKLWKYSVASTKP